MTTSTHIKRRLATLAVIGGVAATLAPLAQAQAGYGRDRVADSVDAARAAQQRASSDLSPQQGYGIHRVADSVDTARAASARDITSSYRLFRSLESQAAPAVEQPKPRIDANGFDWGDFTLGAGTGIGLMLLLGGLGAGLLMRRSREQVKTA
jgi:hypothetical protein